MKSKYSKLFMDIDKLVTKEARSVQDWTNIRLMFTFLEGHMKMMINKERKKPSHFGKKSNNSSSPMSDDVDENGRGKVADKDGYINSINKKSKYEEEKGDSDCEDPYQEPMQRCVVCMKYITPDDEEKENLCIAE